MTPQRCPDCFKPLPHDATTALLCGKQAPEPTVRHVDRPMPPPRTGPATIPPDSLRKTEGAFLGLMRVAAQFHSPTGVNGRRCERCVTEGLCWRGRQVQKNLAELEREMGLSA